MKTSRQLQLFSDQRVAWEALPGNCQQSIQELLSLLLEQSLRQQQEPDSNQLEEDTDV